MSKQGRRPLGLAALLPLSLIVACDAEGRDDRPEAEAPLMDRPVDVATFSQWDEDGDQHLDSLEFVMWTQDENIFEDWMGEEGVDMEVFHDHLQTALDVNADGDIDERDWSIGIQRLFGDEDPGTWEEWDLDGDGKLDGAEFMQGAEHHGLHARIDRNDDAVITIQEVQAFYFALFDRNRDGRIDSNEWNQGRATWLGHDDV